MRPCRVWVMKITDAEHDRYQSKYAGRPGDCYLWLGPLDKDGYGHFYFRRKNRGAHRFAWWLAFGDIPDGMVVNHKCKNRHCVNPQHLEVITSRENSLKDSVSPAAINSRKKHCPKGHPYDRVYGRQRYCSICEQAKGRRLRAKWAAEDTIKC